MIWGLISQIKTLMLDSNKAVLKFHLPDKSRFLDILIESQPNYIVREPHQSPLCNMGRMYLAGTETCCKIAAERA